MLHAIGRLRYALGEHSIAEEGPRMDLNIEDIIWGLKELSDKSEQERLWAGIGNDGDEISSFTEAICCTFDHTGLSKLIEKGGTSERIPPSQIQELEQLSILCKSIPNQLSPMEEIDHPLMIKVRFAAARILANLRAH